MKTVLVVLPTLILLLLLTDHSHTQGALPMPVDRGQPNGLQGGIFFSPNPARTVLDTQR